VQVRNYFLLLAMPMRIVSGKYKPMRVRIQILRFRTPMDVGKENILTVERNRFHKL
jgi:hypothetical protein